MTKRRKSRSANRRRRSPCKYGRKKTDDHGCKKKPGPKCGSRRSSRRSCRYGRKKTEDHGCKKKPGPKRGSKHRSRRRRSKRRHGDDCCETDCEDVMKLIRDAMKETKYNEESRLPCQGKKQKIDVSATLDQMGTVKITSATSGQPGSKTIQKMYMIENLYPHLFL